MPVCLLVAAEEGRGGWGGGGGGMGAEVRAWGGCGEGVGIKNKDKRKVEERQYLCMGYDYTFRLGWGSGWWVVGGRSVKGWQSPWNNDNNNKDGGSGGTVTGHWPHS